MNSTTLSISGVKRIIVSDIEISSFEENNKFAQRCIEIHTLSGRVLIFLAGENLKIEEGKGGAL